MEATYWMTVSLMSQERQTSHRELCIEVRVYEEDGTLYAEPVYYKVLCEGGCVVMDGSYASREADSRMWNLCRLIVEGEYDPDTLAEIRETDPAFAYLRRLDIEQHRIDIERYRGSVL